MSAQLAEKEIARFLKSSKPEVLCISGKWGVGKTYAWNKFLKEAARTNSIAPAFSKYAYVSLFGQNSLQEVRNSIFPSTIPLNGLEDAPSIKTLKDRLPEIKKTWRKHAPQVVSALQGLKPGGISLTGVNFDQLYLLSVRSQIICFDDLERHGKGLQIKDVLGLASYLKEEKKCKVVIILNDGELDEEGTKHFKEQLEKVVDVHLKFDPTSDEAVEIGVDRSTTFHKILSDDLIKLGITNIRVISKIQRLAILLEQKLSDFDPRIFQNALRSLIVLSWSIYQPSEAPSLGFIKDHSPFRSVFRKEEEKKQISTEQAAWESRLDLIGWTNFDEMDLLIADSITNGYFDERKLKEESTRIQENLSADDGENSFSKAWDRYHASFDDDEKEVFDGLYDAFMANPQAISPMNFDATVRIFKEFDREDQASEMIDTYIAKHPGNKKFFDLNDYSFRSDVQDPDVIAAFNEKKETFQDSRSPLEVLDGIAKHSGWNPEDIDYLKKLTPDDFYKIFKDAKGDERHVAVHGALTFAKIRDLTGGEGQISQNAIKALKKIAAESLLNRRRVETYGIKIDDV